MRHQNPARLAAHLAVLGLLVGVAACGNPTEPATESVHHDEYSDRCFGQEADSSRHNTDVDSPFGGLSLSGLVSAADFVVEGEVGQVGERQVGSLTYDDVQLRVTRNFGEDDPGPTLDGLVPVRDSGVELHVAGVPRLEQGDVVIAFLVRPASSRAGELAPAGPAGFLLFQDGEYVDCGGYEPAIEEARELATLEAIAERITAVR